MNPIETMLLMSLFCSGLFIAMQEGHLLNFMRQWAVDAQRMENEEHEDAIYETNKAHTNAKHAKRIEGAAPEELERLNKVKAKRIERLNKEYERAQNKWFWLKPIILCPYCFASFWGTLAFLIIHGLVLETPFNVGLGGLWFISVTGCVVINALLHSLLHKLDIVD